MVQHVIAGIVRHAVAEEEYVYPAAREIVPNGDEMVSHEIEEHSEAEEIMKESEKVGRPAARRALRPELTGGPHQLDDRVPR